MLDFVANNSADGRFWTDEKNELLKTRWKEGFSSSKIGAELGCSRNAIAGKISRLRRREFGDEIAARTKGPPIGAPAPRKRRDYGGGVLHAIKSKGGNNGLALNSPRPRVEPMTPNYVPDESTLCLFLELKPGQCRFPIDRDGQRWFCARPQTEPKSELNNYCAFHHRITHQRIDRSKIRSTFKIYERGG